MPGNNLSVWDAQRLKGRCFLIDIKAVFTTSWSNSKTKHEVWWVCSGHAPELHSPNMKNITHITSLTRPGTCSPDPVGGKRWGPWTTCIDWSSIRSLSKENLALPSATSGWIVPVSHVRLSKPPKRLDLEAKAAWWKHSERNTKLYQTRPPGNEEVVLTLNQEGWSFISLTLSRGRSKIKKESKPQILPYAFQS